MFGSRHAPISHRQHQEAVRGLLGSLLPAIGTDIKGTMQSVDSLKKAAGYELEPGEFQALIEILDKNLHLITPVDDGISTDSSKAQSYQLAHDYLVPSLREWLTRKQRETKKGRAELRLAERTAVWSANKENKQLPTLVEWFQIRYRTDRNRWTMPEQSLMRTASHVHLRNMLGSMLALGVASIVLGVPFYWILQQNDTIQKMLMSRESQLKQLATQVDEKQEMLGKLEREMQDKESVLQQREKDFLAIELSLKEQESPRLTPLVVLLELPHQVNPY